MNGGARVLIIDDEPQMRRAVGAGLRGNGFVVSLAASGEEALDQLALVRPDVVLLDLTLPGMDGLEVVRQLREWSNVPIIVLSARGDERDKVRALDLGADDYLTKPFGMQELLARIRVALRHTGATAAAVALGWIGAWSIGVDVEAQYATFGGSGSIAFAALSGLVLLRVLRADAPRSTLLPIAAVEPA